MAVEYVNRGELWTRLSTDTEPAAKADGTAFNPGDMMLVLDSGAVRIYGSGGWYDDPRPVRDSADADAAVSDVKATKTFYAGGGAKKTGTLATRTLSAANETVTAGYYAATTLSAVEADLAVGNIKTGVNIFGFVGTYDTSATPIVAADIKTGEEGWVNGAKVTGSGTKTLNPANSTVAAGYYAATTLEAVDTDLASANIKSGVTIFGKAGAATVQDIADADAVEGDVVLGKKFYSITGGVKTGTRLT